MGCGGNADEPVPVNPPQLEGFGLDATGGEGGQIIKVTTLSDGGPGSLRWAVRQKGPRVIVFEVGGQLNLKSDLTIVEDNITIAGQTAPSPGVTLQHARLKIQASNVIIEHLRIRPGDRIHDGTLISHDMAENRDAIIIGRQDKKVSQVYLSNLSLSWSVDELLALWYEDLTSDVTIRNSLISEPFWNSLHPRTTNDGLSHGHCLLLGDNVRNILIQENVFANCSRRVPRVNYGNEAIILNNLIYNAGQTAINIQPRDDLEFYAPIKLTVIGNQLIDGPDSRSGTGLIMSRLPLPGQYLLFAEDNLTPGKDREVENQSSLGAITFVESKPVWIEGLEVAPSETLMKNLLKNSGARPWDRDATDKRVLEGIRTGKGSQIDSTDDIGGYGLLRKTRHTLSPPSSPWEDSNGDGHSNFEEWLVGFEAPVHSSEIDGK